MSQENVEAFKRGVDAMNHGDIEGMLELCGAEVTWRDAINAMFGGEATLYRGHDAVRELFRDLYESSLVRYRLFRCSGLGRAGTGSGPPPRARQGEPGRD